MSDKKIVFLDVDGTITNYSNVIPQSAKDAIKAARANGHKVLMCTGRSKAENPPEIWEIGFDGMIGGNGSYVEVDDEVVMHQLVTPEQCRRIVDWCHERGCEFYLESNNGLFASENFREAAFPVMEKYSGGKGAENPEEAAETFLQTLTFGGELYRDDVNKVSFILNSYQDYLDACEDFADMKVGTWGGAGETALFGDMGVANINKAKAVRRVVEHLGGSMEDTLAMGDAKIDIPMLEACAVGIAVASGGDEIKAMADYVTDAVDDDGLANAFRRFGLID